MEFFKKFGRSNQADINADHDHGDYLHVICWKWGAFQELSPCCIIGTLMSKYGNEKHYHNWWEPENTLFYNPTGEKYFGSCMRICQNKDSCWHQWELC